MNTTSLIILHFYPNKNNTYQLFYYLQSIKMEIKTSAIVLNCFKYKEKSLLVKVFTLDNGKQTLIVNNISGKKSKFNRNLFSYLNILEIIYYNSQKQGLKRLKDIYIYEPLYNLQSNLIKSNLSVFLAEVIDKSILEETTNNSTFDFISNSIQLLNKIENGYINFHLSFLVLFSKHLGFFPQNNFSKSTQYFDFKAGMFINKSNNNITQYYNELLSQSIEINYTNMNNLCLTKTERKNLLNMWLDIYMHHLPWIKSINSLQILNSIYSD